MKSKKILKITGIFMAAAVAAGSFTAAAYYTKATNSITNNFSFGNVNLELLEEKWDSLEDDAKILYPGRSVAKDPAVKNIGSLPEAVFLEVHIPMAEVRTVGEDRVTVSSAALTELFTYETDDSWKEIDSYRNGDDTVHIFAYLSELLPGETTSPCFSEITLVNVLEGDLPDGTTADIRVECFGVQSRGLAGSGLSYEDTLLYYYETYY